MAMAWLTGKHGQQNIVPVFTSGYETPINTYQTYQKTVPWSAYIAGSSFKTNSISAINTMSNTSLNIYPNPVNTELHFETERKNVSYSIAISNSLGQQYFVSTNKIEIIEKQLNNSIAKWPNGLYLVTVNDNNGNNKIIKINKL
jgi:hypothetical protein